MDHKGMQGIAFGMMEGVVMVMGMLMGFWAAIPDTRLVLLIIAVTAVADAFANSGALYAEEESERHSMREVTRSSLFCFIATLVAFIVPAIPLLLLPFYTAISAGLILGVILLFALGYLVSSLAGKPLKKIVPKYILLGLAASVACYLVGILIA